MPSTPTKFKALLDRVQQRNREIARQASAALGEDVSHLLKQVVHPPEKIGATGVPALKAGVYAPCTPMLKARFDYASDWEGALGGQSLLSLKQMERLWQDKDMMSSVRIRMEHWSESPPAVHAWDRISLLALDVTGQEETYLIWPDKKGEEPAVVSYLGQLEHSFKDLGSLFEFHVDEERNP